MKEHFSGSDFYGVFLEDHSGRNSPRGRTTPWTSHLNQIPEPNQTLPSEPFLSQDTSNINHLMFKTQSTVCCIKENKDRLRTEDKGNWSPSRVCLMLDIDEGGGS